MSKLSRMISNLVNQGVITLGGQDKEEIELPWYMAGGTPRPVAAYQAIGMANLAESYINLANPGTYDLGVGVVPKFSPLYGWVFTGTEYLTTGIIPTSANWSAICRFSNGTNQVLFGAYNLATQAFQLTPLRSGTSLRFMNQGELVIAAAGVKHGIMAMGGRKGYLDGVQQTGNIGTGTTTDRAMFIGGLNQGAFGAAWIGEIAAIAFYDFTLTPAQVSEITIRMNALSGSWQNPVTTSTNITTGTQSPTEAASRVPHQRASFYSAGLHWLFWGDYTIAGKNIMFQTSADGATWSAATNLTTFSAADANWGVVYDEVNTKVWVLKNIGATGGTPTQDGIMVRRGEPQANGTITWDAVWQTAVPKDTGTGVIGDFSACVDTGGHLWIVGGDDPAPANDVRVYKNDNVDGTWATAAGFPTTLTTTGDGRFGIITALNAGGVYVAVYRWNTDIQATGYYTSDGTLPFVSDGNITTKSVRSYSSGAGLGDIEIDSIGGVVHLVYQETTPASQGQALIWYRTRSALGVWSAEQIVGFNTWLNISSPRLSFGSDGRVYVSWTGKHINEQNIYMSSLVAGVWKPETKITHGQSFDSSFEHVMTERYVENNRMLLSFLDTTYTLKTVMVDTTKV